jgi:hypothetical protein
MFAILLESYLKKRYRKIERLIKKRKNNNKRRDMVGRRMKKTPLERTQWERTVVGIYRMRNTPGSHIGR